MRKRNYTRGLVLLLASALLAVLLAGCGAKSQSASEAYYKESYEAPYAAAYDYGEAAEEAVYEEDSTAVGNGAEAINGSVADNRKLIKNYSLSVETQDLKSYSAVLEERVKAIGGYIENSYEYNRGADYTIRVPAGNLESFVQRVEEDGNVTSKSLSTEDVTLRYVDIESRIKSLDVEEKALLDILEKAETVEDIITVQSRLSEIRYQRENYASTLKTLSNQVDYSTIYLSVTEVKVYTPVENPSFGERLAKEFKRSLGDAGETLADFFVTLIGDLPEIIAMIIVILIVAAIIAAVLRVIFVIFRFIMKKRGRDIKFPSIKKYALRRSKKNDKNAETEKPAENENEETK